MKITPSGMFVFVFFSTTLVLSLEAHAQDETEKLYWNSVDCGVGEEVRSYISTYPNGAYTDEAFECIADIARSEEQRRSIDGLLQACQSHVDENRLTSGAGGNAFECYRRVLVEDPGNIEALAGLTRIEETYIKWARSAIEVGNLSWARTNLDKLRELNPEHPAIGAMEDQVAELERQPTQTPVKRATTSRSVGRYNGPSIELKGQSFLGSADPWQDWVHRFEAELSTGSGGRVKVEFQSAGSIVPAYQVYDAVASGLLDVGWMSGAYLAGKHMGFPILASPPFARSAKELADWRIAQGDEFVNRLYRSVGLNLHGIACGIVGPEGEFWSNRSVNSLQDLKIRNVGLSAQVLQAAGARTVQLPGSEIVPAIERNVIEAFNYSRPYQDLTWGAHEFARYYYYPSPLKAAEVFDFVVNLDRWKSLSNEAQRYLEGQCRALLRYTLEDDERRGREALAELRDRHAISIQPLSSTMEYELRQGWSSVAAALQQEDPDIANVLKGIEQISR